MKHAGIANARIRIEYDIGQKLRFFADDTSGPDDTSGTDRS
jgi:hypothetical protein